MIFRRTIAALAVIVAVIAVVAAYGGSSASESFVRTAAAPGIGLST